MMSIKLKVRRGKRGGSAARMMMEAAPGWMAGVTRRASVKLDPSCPRLDL